MVEPKQYIWNCPVCTDPPRTVGPYYDKALMIEAKNRHNLSQHVSDQSALYKEQPGDARIRSATTPTSKYQRSF